MKWFVHKYLCIKHHHSIEHLKRNRLIVSTVHSITLMDHTTTLSNITPDYIRTSNEVLRREQTSKRSQRRNSEPRGPKPAATIPIKRPSLDQTPRTRASLEIRRAGAGHLLVKLRDPAAEPKAVRAAAA